MGFKTSKLEEQNATNSEEMELRIHDGEDRSHLSFPRVEDTIHAAHKVLGTNS